MSASIKEVFVIEFADAEPREYRSQRGAVSALGRFAMEAEREREPEDDGSGILLPMKVVIQKWALQSGEAYSLSQFRIHIKGGRRNLKVERLRAKIEKMNEELVQLEGEVEK